ncbi:hypothetical protein TVAG_406350 [Trichomonas vaginalis G3]|uniref:Bap-like n=2 Tax=Trichomonas vaginalis (strain ATCC PRA-98 / G3) TaxID=412133 RepID=A2FNZ1_TRIV3|nr:hypothetical protein TVAG_406350 [Trichomonas vaginalis G3]|eukprot:XP_001306301.1 hypothetical protein [Trichomonas vaginalis G3]
MSLNIFYQLKGKTPERIGTFEVNSNLTTNVFSFTIQVPDEVTPQSLKIWAEDRGQVVATLDKGYSVINLRPMLKITNKVNQRYYNRGFIDIEFRVWDNTRVRLWYCIDGGREINITDYIECNGEWKEDFAQIELPAGFYEFGSHKLYIFVRDEFGAESADTPYDFLLIDQNAPDMEILSVETKEEYEYNDIVLLQGRVRDIDPGDKISVSLQLNRQGYKEIFSTISTGDWQYFNYSFSVPKNDGLHIVTFQARDNMSAASRASCYKIKVRRPRGISMRKQLPSYAEPSLPIEIGGYVVPSTFKPEITKVRVMGRFGNSGTRFYIDVFTIHNSMSATDFNFNFTVPRDAKSGIVEIIFDDDNNDTDVLENFTQNIIINERPNLKILKDIGERFPAHAFIDIDSEIRDDTKANIRYKIDDGVEMNATDFIECLGNDKRVRTQIEIKPGSLQFRKHTITIYAVDEYGLTSNSTTYSFYYYNSNTPELTVTNIEEISDHTFKITDKITISGIVDDADIEDNLRVRMRFDFEKFDIIHTCSSSDRDQCKKFNYTFNVPRSTGNHEIILQALDDRDFVSKDVKINFKVEKHFVSPARTPASFPVFPKIPTGYTGRTTYTTAITAVETFITDINGDIFVTYTDIITTYEITVIDPTTEQVEIGFLQTTFGKYILWPIIACIVIIAVVIIIVLVILKKNQNDESSTDLAGNNEEQFEMEQETIIISKTEESMVTTDNPLFTTQNSAAADDPFHEDFEDKGGLFSDSDNDVVDANIDQSDSDIVDDGEEIKTIQL